MKKYFYILVIFLLFHSVVAHANQCSNSCIIEDAPSPALTQYITNLHTVTWNIVDSLAEGDIWVEWDIEGRFRNVLSSLDLTRSASELYTSFDYYVKIPIQHNIPSQINRDHDLIEQEWERLTSLLSTAEKRATWWVIVESVCGGIPNCDLSWLEARQALIDLIQNNQKILDFYRKSIVDKASLSQSTPYLLVQNTFPSEMMRAYNSDTLKACSGCGSEWGLLDIEQDLSKIMESISGGFESIKDSTHSWKEAFALLRWESPSWDGNPSLERELLSSFLKEQWVDTEQADIMMGNLERYNAWGLSTSNPALNSINEYQTKVFPVLDSFWVSIGKWIQASIDLWEDLIDLWEDVLPQNDTIPYSYIYRVRNEVLSTEEISQNIATLYNEEIPFAIVEDTTTQELQARIIRMHYSLVRSANILEWKIEDAEELCDKQWVGLGKCSYQKIFKLTWSYDSVSN